VTAPFGRCYLRTRNPVLIAAALKAALVDRDLTAAVNRREIGD